jgi:hypothetical protein
MYITLRIYGFITKDWPDYSIGGNCTPGSNLSVMKRMFLQLMWIFGTPEAVVLSVDMST